MPRILELCAAVSGNAFLTPQEFTEKTAVTDFAKTLDAAAKNEAARDQISGRERPESKKTPDPAPSKDVKAADEPTDLSDPDAEKKTDSGDGDVLAIQAMIDFVQLTAVAEGAADEAAAPVAEPAAPEIAPVSAVEPGLVSPGMPLEAADEASLTPGPNAPTESSQAPEAEIVIPAAEDSESVQDFISEVNAALEKARDAAQPSEPEPSVAIHAERPAEPEKTDSSQPENDAEELSIDRENEPVAAASTDEPDAQAQTDAETESGVDRSEDTGSRRRVSAPAQENHFAVNHFKPSAAGETAAPQKNEELAKAVETAMTRFTDDFRGVEASGSTVTIALTPEELGSVSITLTAENNALTAKIVTDNKEAASMLSEQIQQFVDSMAEKGVTVEKTEVVYSQTGQSGQSLGEGRHEADTRDSRENNYFFFSGDERVEAEVSYIGLRDIYESAARYYGEEPAPVDYKA